MPRTGLLMSLVSLAALGAVVGLVPDLREAVGAAVRGDTDELRVRLRGAEGVALLFAVTLVHAVVWYPAEIATGAAGFVWGFWAGTALVQTFWVISALATYGLGRHMGRPAVRRLAGERRTDRLERSISRGGIPVLIGARLIPIVPFSLTGYIAGIARVPLWRFTWTTAIGYLPLTVAGVLIGERLDRLSWTDPVLWAACLPVLVLIALSRPLARRLRLDDD